MKKQLLRVGTVAVLLAALTLFAACADEQTFESDSMQAEESAQSSDAGEAAQPVTFTARDLDGNAVTEAVFANADLTMLNVWATFCGPCLQEMPDLGELSEEYADKGVQIVGVVSDVGDSEADMQTVRDIIDSTGADYVHLLPSAEMQSGLLADMMYVPTTLFFDRNGNQINGEIVGSKSKADWEAVIDRMLSLATAKNAETEEPAGE